MEAIFNRNSGNSNKTAAQDLRLLVSHPDVKINDALCLSIKRLEAIEEEKQVWEFDFNEAFLPINSTYSSVSSFADYPNHMKVVILCAQEYLKRCKNSKSRTSRVRKVISDVTMTLEYLWMNDVHKLEDARPYHFSNLVLALSEGGWVNALDIRNRADDLDDRTLKMFAQGEKPHSFTRRFIDGKDIRRLLGTNSKNLRAFFNTERDEKNDDARWSASTLSETLSSINFLYDIESSLGLAFPPYGNRYKIANKIGVAASRTNNIDAGSATILLKTAVSWVSIYGPTVVELIEEVAQEVVECRNLTRKYMGRRLKNFFKNLPKRAAAQNNLPFPIEYLDFGRATEERSNSLRTAVLCLLTACYVIIAAMNGRRKDEISHKKFGLRKGDLRVIDEDMDLFQIDFYVEKTYRSRIPFYVNRLTADAVRLLERLDDSYHKIDQALSKSVETGARPLFSYRRFSQMRGVGNEKKWYSFSTSSAGNENDATSFLRQAFGDTAYPAVSSHMFRRMYALIFYYQYENADLQALMYQLGHFDLQSTMIYITDPASRSEFAQISNVMDIRSSEIQKARRSHIVGLERELLAVGSEKFSEDVFAILTGERLGGGYQRFVRRVHAKLSSTLKIDLDRDTGISTVSVLKQRGHFPRPMRHGKCMAGSSLSVKSAHCVSNNKNELDRGLANASTCANCMFHLTSASYTSNIENDLLDLKKEIDSIQPGTIKYGLKEREHRNVSKALEILRIRLNEEKIL
jgi:integrase